MFESLETRRMLSVTLAGAKLTVDGNELDNYIYVQQVNPTTFEIYEDGTTTIVTGNRVIKQIVLNGLGGDDMLVLLPSVDRQGFLNGGTGDDTMMGGVGPDRFNGDGGTDQVSYENSDLPVRAILNNAADDGAFGEGDNINGNVEEIVGSEYNDLIIGNSLDNFLDGRGGGDDIRGGAGNDLIFGGEGADNLDGGLDDDTIAGNAGADFIQGGLGDDEVEINDSEVDTATGGDGTDTVYADGSGQVVDNIAGFEDVFLV